MKLVDRRAECRMLDRLVEAVCAGVGELIANPSPAERQAVRHALLGLEVVLPDGHAPARFGGETMKDVAGYDTKRLFIGSHNAFGTITTAIFKISVRAALGKPTASPQAQKERLK